METFSIQQFPVHSITVFIVASTKIGGMHISHIPSLTEIVQQYDVIQLTYARRASKLENGFKNALISWITSTMTITYTILHQMSD